SAPPASSPSAHTKLVAAPARAAATAWLNPLPPGPLRYSPARVAPGAGSSAHRHTWSTLNDPTTTTLPATTAMPASGIGDVGAAVRGDLVAFTAPVAVLEQQHERDRHRQRVQRERHPDAVPVLDASGVGEPAVDDEARDQAAQHRADAVGHQHEQSLGAGADARIALLLDEQ